MSDYIWVIPRDKANSLGALGVSSSYIIPSDHLRVISASDLLGCLVWVLLRGDTDRLALVLRVHKISTISNDYYQGDLLLKPDIQNSLRTGSSYRDLESFVTSISVESPEGLSTISSADIQSLSSLLARNVTVRLSRPNYRIFSRIDLDDIQKTRRTLARTVIQMAVSSFNLNEIWCDGRHKKYRTAPYASIAKAYLEYKFPEVDLSEIEEVLLNTDPLLTILGNKFTVREPTVEQVTKANAPSIDAMLGELNLNHIFARTFNASNSSDLDPLTQIKKTEKAEHRHQEILRDVSKYLLSQGVKPLQSKSIDLAYRSNSTLQLFEIKTSNIENAISQSSKAAFQLAAYKNALFLDHDKIVLFLILEDTRSSELNAFISKAMQVLGIGTYFYNEALPWPNRLTTQIQNKVADQGESLEVRSIAEILKVNSAE